MIALDDWIDKEARFAVGAMLRAVSATNLVKERPGFGQRVVPRPGSVLASPIPAAYDPDPDYFFHWFRDSAIIIDALRVAQTEGFEEQSAVERLREFVDFHQALRKLDGREFALRERFREKVQPSFLQYVRSDDEINAVFGDAVLADARVNPDGTLDFTRWSRPQNDGPALQVMIGWQHNVGDVTPQDSVSFLGGGAGAPFSIDGTPLATDALVLNSGLDFAITDRFTVGLGLTGQFSAVALDQRLRGIIKFRL